VSPRALVIVMLPLLAAACGDGGPIEPHDVWIGLQADVEEVGSGEGFALTVVRIWRADLEPEEWDDASLSPLTVRLEETTRREAGGHVEETRKYRAHAFARTDVTVGPIEFRARTASGAAGRSARSNRLDLRVRTAVDADDPGPAELPGGFPKRSFPWMPTLAAVVLVLGAGLVILRRRRRRTASEEEADPEAAGPEAPRAWERALRRLAELRDGPADVLAFHTEAACCLRDYLREQFRVGTIDLTTEEVLAAVGEAGVGDDFRRRVLGDLLGQCDAVKFARGAPSADQRESLLATAEVFVRETAGVSSGAGGAP